MAYDKSDKLQIQKYKICGIYSTLLHNQTLTKGQLADVYATNY